MFNFRSEKYDITLSIGGKIRCRARLSFYFNMFVFHTSVKLQIMAKQNAMKRFYLLQLLFKRNL